MPEAKFRVKILPSNDGYLTGMVEYAKNDLYLSSKTINQDFSDLTGPEFIQIFDKEKYNNLQRRFLNYLPAFNSKDNRFEFIGKENR
ncbi:hypothetical protein [Lactobacillus acetotolerans]|uniref:hypothetical protein n=1 Tax=Lactobacillus acetotolerans TaxID=1600 RepID=UPI002FD969C1